MPFTIIVTVKRKAGTTPQQFRDHYNNGHVPLVKRLTGSTWPKHTRQFVIRNETKPANPDADKTSNEVWQSEVLRGSPSNVDFDCLTTMVWEDRAAWDRFLQKFYEHSEEILADELSFAEPFEIICVEEPVTTDRD
ncbi:uncharacterized protein F4822DRAFT_306278 [Hypoxylon trugodes]|uniref:uncharacterized protein n=1 Tax=Hypoxylon trugodes TaxID=326681 RepID=UPI0021A12AD9|nr:uncharacterized protein F4822DRAFT_306278 [Hypoxylon trugodes]KAI1386121.1 hypothetical protein F4822DRAFT_306278 [Hypoxylon trugodes]